jgi:hypothetical protein
MKMLHCQAPNKQLLKTSRVGSRVLLVSGALASRSLIQALTIFDHYHFRVLQAKADASDKPIQLKKAPKNGQKPWWDEGYTKPRKILDRELFA